MTRVVCPLCRIGFEANISSDNFAINCVSCGAAFNAMIFLSKTKFAIKAERRPNVRSASPEHSAVAPDNIILPVETSSFAPPAADTHTGSLPFMDDNDLSAHQTFSVKKKDETCLPVLPNSPLKKADSACVSPADSSDLDDVIIAPTPPPAAPVKSLPASETPPVISRRSTRRPLLEGSFGPYEIEGEIARGGVGAVFHARERDTGRSVALKVLLDGDEAGETERERFQHECETAKALSLPGMVQVYAVGEIDQKPYMAMELVNGHSLDKIIPKKSLSVNDCLVLMQSVAETIGALHEAGYVHRDLKPGNILIDAFGSPKVADFGLIKSLDEVTRMTASGLVCGTPAYMAPEQARGDGQAVDPRSDVWALGAVLYEMLTAQPPFQAENALRLMLRITKESPRSPRKLNLKVPQDVQYIVLKCLEKNADRRYANARALAVDIGRFLNGEPLLARPQPKMRSLAIAAIQNRRRLMAVGGGIAAIVVVAVLARLLLAPRDATPLVEHGRKALSEGALESADRYFRDAIALDRHNARAHFYLGLCVGRAGIQPQGNNQQKVDEAMTLTAQACRLDPKLRVECHAQVATFNYWQKQHEYEARELEKAVELAPNNPKYRERLAMAYWRAGVQTQSHGYYKKAVSEFQSVLDLNPTCPKVREYIKQLQENFLTQQSAPSSNGLATRGRR
ncbi:MAG: serine/threonine-protein kinase [Planctomycetota bacterium]